MKYGQRASTKPSISQMLQSVFSEAEQVMERGALSTSITNAGLSTASLPKGPFSWAAHQELWGAALVTTSCRLPKEDMPPVQMDQDLQKCWGKE